MATEQEAGIQIGDLRGMIQRRAWLIGGVAGAILLLTIFVAAVLPDQYEAVATLLIEPQTISERLVESNLSESNLNDRLHLISMQILSRGRLSKIIDDLGIYRDESREMTREEIIEAMREEISVRPLLSELEAQAGIRNRDIEINTFQLTYRHTSPEISAEVANRLARDFIDEHLSERTKMSRDTSEFINQELARLSGRLAEVEEQIAAVKSKNAGRLPEDLPSNQRVYERVLDSMRSAQREYAVAQSDEAFYRQQVLSGGAEFNKYNNDITPERKVELLNIRLAEYASRGFTAKHPDVISARLEIAELEAKIAEGATVDGDSTSLSVGQQNARAEQQRASLRAESAKRELERLRAQQEAVEAALEATPRVAEQLGALEREYEHLFDSYQEFSAKQLEASVAADMEFRQKGEQFRVLEAAVPPVELASPNRPVIVLLGLILGLGIAMGVAILVEAGDSSFHDARTLQGQFRIPVLATVPDVLFASDRADRTARNARRLMLAGIVTAAVLVASLAGHWFVNGLPSFISSSDAPAAPARG